MVKVGDRVRFNKIYEGFVVEIAEWDEQHNRWKLSNGEHSILGPYILHIPGQNLIIGVLPNEIEVISDRCEGREADKHAEAVD